MTDLRDGIALDRGAIQRRAALPAKIEELQELHA